MNIAKLGLKFILRVGQNHIGDIGTGMIAEALKINTSILDINLGKFKKTNPGS